MWSQAEVLLPAAVHSPALDVPALSAYWSSLKVIDASPVVGLAVTPKSSAAEYFAILLAALTPSPTETTLARCHVRPNRDHKCAQRDPHEFDVGNREGHIACDHDSAGEDTIEKVDERYMRMGCAGGPW